MEVKQKSITFLTLDSADSEIDALYFIKQMFSIYQLDFEAKLRVLDYVTKMIVSEEKKQPHQPETT